jgi:hypothetical protein
MAADELANKTSRRHYLLLICMLETGEHRDFEISIWSRDGKHWAACLAFVSLPGRGIPTVGFFVSFEVPRSNGNPIRVVEKSVLPQCNMIRYFLTNLKYIKPSFPFPCFLKL